MSVIIIKRNHVLWCLSFNHWLNCTVITYSRHTRWLILAMLSPKWLYISPTLDFRWPVSPLVPRPQPRVVFAFSLGFPHTHKYPNFPRLVPISPLLSLLILSIYISFHTHVCWWWRVSFLASLSPPWVASRAHHSVPSPSPVCPPGPWRWSSPRSLVGNVSSLPPMRQPAMCVAWLFFLVCVLFGVDRGEVRSGGRDRDGWWGIRFGVKLSKGLSVRCEVRSVKRGIGSMSGHLWKISWVRCAYMM